MFGTATWLEIATRPIVWPSGVDCASVVGPSAPAPPTTFFTMTVAFSRFSKRLRAMMRAVRSVDAPGALGLMSEISRAGHLLDWRDGRGRDGNGSQRGAALQDGSTTHPVLPPFS